MTVNVLTPEHRATLDELLTTELLDKLRHACKRRAFGTFEPDELYSLTLLRITRSIDTFKGGNFAAWCMTVLKSTWKNELMRRANEPQHIGMPDSMLEGWDEAVALPYVLEDEVWMGFSHKVKEAMLGLNHKQREALLLYGEGYTYDEIRQIQGTHSLGTICTRVQRSRTKMRAALSA